MFDKFPRSRRWNARWIWLPGDDGRILNAYCLFRREFVLGEQPCRHRLFITAESFYRAYVNGRLVGTGPPPSVPFLKFYDEYEVGEFLRPGRNCIAVVVYFVGALRQPLPELRAGLLAELVDDKGGTTIATGPDWRCKRGDAWERRTFAYRWNHIFPFQEVFDARREPVGWTEPGFDEQEWQGAAVVAERGASDRPPVLPWARLLPRQIPLMVEEPVLPERVEKVEENLDLANRTRPEDLSIALSMPGRPVRHSRVERVESLIEEEGETVIQCSTKHLEGYFDGIYDPSVVLDFGRVITARLEVKLTGVEGGMLDIGYAERLIDGHFNNTLEGLYADRYIMKEGEQTFRTFVWRGFRFVKLRFRSCFKPVRVHYVKAITTTYPFEERGAFQSADSLLNKVFEASRYTVKLCSNDFLMDTPWREQAQWLGDVAAVTIPAIYACFGDTKLTGKFLMQAAAYQFPTGLLANVSNALTHTWRTAFPDYSLWWVMALWRHFLYTGEERWIHRFYPEAARVIHAHMEYVNEWGLVENIPYRPLIDWAPVDRRGECAAFNAIFYGALGAFAEMARFKGDSYTLEWVKEERRRLKENFVGRLFDSKRGCFADANVEGRLSERTSEHANAAAILFGLCDEERARGIIRRLWEERSVEAVEAQPFFTSVVLWALDKVGRFDLALDIVRERWGRRMVERGFSSTLEEWYENGSWRDGTFKGFLRSHSHAWSACPAEFLIRGTMGLRILEPGCGRVRIAPKDVPFDYRLVYPTPLGDIEVRRKGGKVDVKSPEEIEVVMEE